MNFRKLFGLAAMSIVIIGAVSCSKDDDSEKDDDNTIKTEDFIGTWTASTDKYNLSMNITASGYQFALTQPGAGGISDNGTYIISDAGRIIFTNTSNTVLASGELQNGKLTLTFTSSVMIMMLGATTASNVVFTKDGGTTSETYTVSGTLEYSEAATWTTVVAVLDDEGDDTATTSIANKRFSLSMPTPKTTSLAPYSEYVPTGITANPSATLVTIATFYAVKGTQNAEIMQVGLSGSTIVSIITYIYSDRDATVSGTYTYPGIGKDVFNLQLKKGWNSVINTWDYSTTSEDDFYTTGAVPSSSAWITEADISDSDSDTRKKPANSAAAFKRNTNLKKSVSY